jgi:hypothetical protein
MSRVPPHKASHRLTPFSTNFSFRWTIPLDLRGVVSPDFKYVFQFETKLVPFKLTLML